MVAVLKVGTTLDQVFELFVKGMALLCQRDDALCSGRVDTRCTREKAAAKDARMTGRAGKLAGLFLRPGRGSRRASVLTWPHRERDRASER